MTFTFKKETSIAVKIELLIKIAVYGFDCR